MSRKKTEDRAKSDRMARFVHKRYTIYCPWNSTFEAPLIIMDQSPSMFCLGTLQEQRPVGAMASLKIRSNQVMWLNIPN